MHRRERDGATIREGVEAFGLVVRGAPIYRPILGAGGPAHTVLPIGNVGDAMWPGHDA